MIMRIRIVLLTTFVLPGAIGAPATAEENKSAAEWIAAGNAHYREGRFIDALEAYNDAGAQDAPQSTVSFNRGLAHYALGEFDKATAEFGNAMLGGDRELEARARFNLGNCAYATALARQQENPKEAIESLHHAIDYYADTLEMLPDDEPTAENMQLAQALIKQLQQKQQQQQQPNPEQNDQNQDPQQQNEQQQDQQQKPSSQPSENQQQKQPSSQPNEDQQPQQQGEQDSKDQQQQEQQQNQQQQQGEQQHDQQQQDQQQDPQAGQNNPPPDAQPSTGDVQQGEPHEMKMSKEQAQRLLQGIRDKEKARRKETQEQRRVLPAPSGKDW